MGWTSTAATIRAKKKKVALSIAALPFRTPSLFPWEYLQTSYHLIGWRIGRQVHLHDNVTGWRQGIQLCLPAAALTGLRDGVDEVVPLRSVNITL